MKELGVQLGTARLGAHVAQFFDPKTFGQFDDARDQDAIRYGYTDVLDILRGGARPGGPAHPGASGGYVLYPNKPNTNTMRSVYRK